MTVATELFFHGAAETVTGSCYRVVLGRQRDGKAEKKARGGDGEAAAFSFLVDCGLFQGTKTLAQLNYGPFPFDAKAVRFLLLTHAHIDHSGLIPKLARHGFKGPVYATAASRDLLGYMLPDSGHIQEMEVQLLNKRNRRRGRAAVQPIYTHADAEAALDLIRPVALLEWFEPAPGVRARFWNAGHILGSASIEVEIAQGGDAPPIRLLFSGDIGPWEKSFHPDPSAPADLDYLVVESTYGNRDRARLSAAERREMLRRELAAGLRKDGIVLIPAFAIERTQELLYDIAVLMETKAVAPTPVFLDSPLAIRATGVFEAHAAELEEKDFNRLVTRNPNFRFVQSVEESIALARIKGNAVIMAASGMCEAGRIRHHLKNNLWRRDATVLFVGYQAPGTLGRILQDGGKQVRIHGQEVAVNARVRALDSYSAHADRAELARWAVARLPARGAVFLTHGEGDALDGLKQSLMDTGTPARQLLIPRLGESFRLVGGAQPGSARLERGRPERGAGTPVFPRADVAAEDWHNAYARLLLDLGTRLQDLDNGARVKLLAKLKKDLGGE